MSAWEIGSLERCIKSLQERIASLERLHMPVHAPSEQTLRDPIKNTANPSTFQPRNRK